MVAGLEGDAALIGLWETDGDIVLTGSKEKGACPVGSQRSRLNGMFVATVLGEMFILMGQRVQKLS